MNNITLSNLFKAFSDALLGKSDAETIQIPNGPNPEIFGVDDIKIGDRFYGYGCGLYWENQECTHINKEVLDEALDKTPINILKTVELNIINADLFTSQKYDEVNKIITINDNRFLFLDKIKNKYNYQLKIQSIKTSNKILWTTELNNFEETNCDNLEGKKYKDDVIVK